MPTASRRRGAGTGGRRVAPSGQPSSRGDIRIGRVQESVPTKVVPPGDRPAAPALEAPGDDGGIPIREGPPDVSSGGPSAVRLRSAPYTEVDGLEDLLDPLDLTIAAYTV